MHQFRLLGSPQVLMEGQRIELRTSKPAALLLYLIVQGGWVSREVLAELLSPELGEQQARHNLRLNLSRALKLPWARGVEVEPSRLRFEVVSDVAEVVRAAAAGDVAKVMELGRQPLLEGFSLESVPALAAWAEEERARLEQLFVEALTGRAAELRREGREPEALGLLEQRLGRDPLSEQTVQAALSLCLSLEDRERGMRLYGQFAQVLREEAQLEPLVPTQALLDALRRNIPVPAVSRAEPLPEALRGSPQLVGRDAERARLRAALPGWVLLSGEAGIGKSHLLRSALPQARWLSCSEGLRGVPYHPLMALLRREPAPDVGAYNEDLARVLPEGYPHLSPAPLDPHSARLRLLEALARALTGDGRPLVVDDAQWADPATLEWITYLRGRPGLSLVVAYRREEEQSLSRVLGEWRLGALELRLEALGVEAVGQWLRSLIGRPDVPHQFAAWLHRHSGGHPLYVLETLRSLFEAGVLRQGAHDWHADLDRRTRDYAELPPPPKLRQLIVARLERLAPPTQRFLEALSVVGDVGTVPAGLLAGLLNAAPLEVLEASEAAQASALLSADTERPQFAHDLLRQAIAASLTPQRRRYWHAAAAAWLESRVQPETDDVSGVSAVIAHHWQAAGEPEKSWPARLRQADSLQRGGHYAAATEIWRDLLAALPPRHPLELQTRVRLGRFLLWENLDEGRQQLETALALVGTRPSALERGDAEDALTLLTIEAQVGLSELSLYQGDGPQAQAHLNAALSRAAAYQHSGRNLPTPLAQYLIEQRLETGFRCGQYTQVQGWLDAESAPWPLLRVYQAHLDFYAGRYRRAAERLSALLDDFPELAHAVTLSADLGLCHTLLGELAQGRRVLALSFEQAAGNPHALTLSHSNLGLLEVFVGNLNAAQRHLTQAEALARQINSKTYLADILHRQAAIDFTRGDLEAATARLAEAHTLMRAVRDPFRQMYIGCVHAALLAAQGRTEAAAEVLSDYPLGPDQPLLARLFYHRAWTVLHLQRQQPQRAAHHSRVDLKLAGWAELTFELGHAQRLGAEVQAALRRS